MSADKYISELTQKFASDITGEYSFVVQSPSGGANTTYRIIGSELVKFIQNNVNYGEVYGLPIETDSDTGDTILSIITDPSSSPVSKTDLVWIKAISGNVGIKTDTPTATLEIFSSDATNGDMMITPTTGEKFGFHVSESDGDASPEVLAKFQIGRKDTEDSSFVPLISIEETGDIELGVGLPNSVTTVTGFTSFGGGTDSPEIKMIKLTGTTGTVSSSPFTPSVSVAHGIDRDKIISCSVLVKDNITGDWIPPNDRSVVGDTHLYSFLITDTDLVILLEHEGSPYFDRSSTVEESEFVCTIIYEK